MFKLENIIQNKNPKQIKLKFIVKSFYFRWFGDDPSSCNDVQIFLKAMVWLSKSSVFSIKDDASSLLTLENIIVKSTSL